MADGVPLLGGFLPLAVNEDGAAKTRHQTDSGPAANLTLGDKGGLQQTAEDDNVEIRDVVGDIQGRNAGRWHAMHDDVQSDQATDDQPVKTSEGSMDRGHAQHKNQRVGRQKQD